ncbi:MAG: guanylate kinase [Selenomonadaceae bacterium]|uniref:Guanylate kinase n=2 Tax=Anaerovibrio slackiae TaxID=2652309 RepID=A0A6I2UBY4_9FIRM|nr:guanylate kinase [Anaerovibrio slackiae]MBQ2009285.1 guanylate kinase [Selenomonadaceae bacterium]MBQ5585016.1 guanylate kinase [Selenomonadaceae bacterium]MBQ5651807.1 guanylate kinase [Selenomonadaceae bacterium]MBQ5733562.1 guanylate kinase [Selenomonadaceae bacterium]MBQ5845185.1 guanylate kinase [Selenomonadaceae bacterium]
MRKGLLILISGPSGTGKGTVCDLLRKNHPEISYSISATTRQPRPGEQDGVNYYFYDKEKFRQMIDAGELLEWAEVYGNYYGTPKQKVLDRLNAGEDILLEIDTQGALNVMKAVPEGLFIFLLPPSLEELANRLKGRGTETEESLQRRLGAAVDEIKIAHNYRYVVVNDKVEAAEKAIAGIIEAEHHRTDLNEELLAGLQQWKENA